MGESLISKIQGYGFEVESLNLDGRVHRFRTTNKPKKKNGWYVGKTITLRGGKSLDVVTVGDWAIAESQTFTSRDDLTDVDRKMFSAAAKKMQAEMDALQEIERGKTAKEAALLWADGVEQFLNFPYLLDKQISALSATSFAKMSKDQSSLIIPIYNLKGEIRSCQMIGPGGEKMFLTGGEVRGNFFPMRGSGNLAIICEGFSTGVTIYSALDGKVDVIIAFNAGNLFPVCSKMVLEYGAESVFIAADDDRYNGVNAGLTSAQKCLELGVKVFVPDFTAFGYESKPTDFNDLFCLGGLSLVAEQIALTENNTLVKPESSLATKNEAASDLRHVKTTKEAAEFWPSKDIGFYVMVPQRNGELRAVPRFAELAKYFSLELKLRFSDAMVLIWSETHYISIDKTELLGLIHRLTLGRAQPDHLEKFLKMIRAECDESQKHFVSSDGFVNMRNGVLNIQTKELTPHSPAFDFRYVLPYNFDVDATCPNWDKFLNEIFVSDQELIGLASEIFGYSICGGKPFLHKAFMLYGIGRNGKSVFLDVLRAMIGPDNCASKSIESLHEKFARSSLVGKLANISQETSKREVESGVFKSIVAGDTIDASFKGKDEFDFTPTCRMFFAGNFFPTFKDSSAGMNDRLVIIPFERYFSEEERDSGITERLIGELSGIFNNSLQGLGRLLARKRLPKVEAIENLREEYQTASCSVFGFMSNKCETVESFEWRKLADFYKPYEEYCIDQKIQPKSKVGFAMTLTGYLRKKLGNRAIRKDRDKFTETNRLAVFGEIRAIRAQEKVRRLADAKQCVKIENEALNITRKNNALDLPGVLV